MLLMSTSNTSRALTGLTVVIITVTTIIILLWRWTGKFGL